jgi:hypothetical protein
MNELKEDLIKHFEQFSTAPFLFIGSGFSRRYLNLETWGELLAKVINEIGGLKPYEYYQSKTKSDNAKIATAIAHELHEKWWTEDAFETSRNVFKSAASENEESPLKYEVSEFIKKKTKTSESDYLEEIEALCKINVDGIITTNWDTFLEDTFPDFKKYIGQSELLFSNSLNIGELYKIHGCVSKPNSLVLTSKDYEDFEVKNPYLAAKLLTIFVEHPIVFIGYSLHDPNVINILSSIVNCLNNDNIDKLKNRLVFVKRIKDNSEPSITDSTIILTDKQIPIPIKEIKLNSFTPLYSVLSSLKKRLPVKVLRHMKGMVYDYVKTNVPSEKVLVSESIGKPDDAKNIEFYFGFGIKSQLSTFGYKGIGTKELLQDLMFENQNFNSEAIIDTIIPEALKARQKYFPVFKYLRNEKHLTKDGKVKKTSNITEKLTKFVDSTALTKYYPGGSYSKKKNQIQSSYNSIKSVQRAFDFRHSMLYIPLLKEDNISVSDLKGFILTNWDEELLRDTHFKKLICLYDYLKYGKQKNN